MSACNWLLSKLRSALPTYDAATDQVYQPPRFLTINEAISQLLEVEDSRQEGAYNRDSLCVGMARVGSEQQTIVAGAMSELLDVDFGPPLHSLIIAGQLHHVEEDMLQHFRVCTS